MKRINDKIKEIENFLEELNKIMPSSFEEYKKIEKKAACERYVEKIMEAVTDLAFLAIKSKGLEMPEDDADSFNILMKNSIITERLSERMKQAKGMRNIIAHQYGRIDDRVIYDAIKNELEKDSKEFIKKVKNV